MGYSFMIEPVAFQAFESEDEQLDKCKEWGLVSEKAAKTKSFLYKRNGMSLPCTVVGFVDKTTAVIEFENREKHCIHPSYLKEMQASSFGAKATTAAEDAEPTEGEGEAESEEVEAIPKAAQEPVAPLSATPPGLSATPPGEVEPPKAADRSKDTAKKGKAPKLELPEEKVKMTATVQAFTTVPNNFSDTEDEVIIYEAAAILEPELEIGAAWSSHSATLKKLELQIGDTLTFEGKIVAKKLSKHPVPYKINNPAKIVKSTKE